MMSKVEISPLSEVKQSMYVDLRAILDTISKFLRENKVDRPVIIDEETHAAILGHEVLEALSILGCEKIPVLKINFSEEASVKSMQPGLTPVTKENIVNAALKGPKLPYNSFKVTLKRKVPKINVSLEELGTWKVRKAEDLKVFNSTLELLYKGWPTPLVKVNSLSKNGREVWAKLEGYNPFSNSVKDRIGWSMIMDAYEKGSLKEIIYEATSTNTGIALASIANILKVKTKLFIPKSIQKVSDTFLRVLGSEVIRVPVGLTVESIGLVDENARKEGATHLNQFENDANFKVHLKYTARELDEQLMSIGLKPDYIIGGVGTSGHMSAISLYFKSRYGGDVKVFGVQPAPNEVIPGIRRVETGMKWIHWLSFDGIIDVKRKEAVENAIWMARREGLLIGLSAGAVLSAFKEIARGKGIYILVFPDTGYKYAEQFEEYFQSSP